MIDKMTPSLKKITQNLIKLPEKAFKVFVIHTPIKSGNARKHTTLDKSTIRAQYQYAKVLNKGSSKQSPDGMVKPTEVFIKQELKKIMRK